MTKKEQEAVKNWFEFMRRTTEIFIQKELLEKEREDLIKEYYHKKPYAPFYMPRNKDRRRK